MESLVKSPKVSGTPIQPVGPCPVRYFPFTDEEIDAVAARRDPAWNAISVTPCVRAEKLSALTGADLSLKLENLQYTGSFKERGALTRLLALAPDQRARGVIAASAGNHAQGLARHAALLGIRVRIVMPVHTPSVKVEQTRDLGAEVLLQGAGYDEAGAAAAALAKDTGMVLVHPFDDPHVALGQGTAAVEMIEQAGDLDTLVVPIGGGGLAAGTAFLAKRARPSIRVIGVQSALYPGMLNVLRGTARPCGGDTLAEGIAVREPGRMTRGIIRDLVDEVVTVEEAQLERALCLLLGVQKVLAEGAGAAGLAAVLAHRSLFRGRKVGLIVCGGNIDSRLLSAILMRDLARQRRLARLRVTLIDVPGQLTRVSAAIAKAGGNVIDVSYHKIFNDLPAKKTYLDISVEASDAAQMDAIVAALEADGLDVQPANY